MTFRELLKANADFRRLWTGQVISEIGDWLNNIAVLALTIQVAGAGHEGLAIAIYAIARHLPLFLFGPMAGVVADRFDRRRIMIASDFARAFLALGFILANRFLSLSIIYVVGSLLFSVSSFFNAAKRASIPNLTRGTEELLSANSLSASTTAATIAVGSALGGMVATFMGRNTVFVINALTFLASAEMIRRIRARLQRDAETLEQTRRGDAGTRRRGEKESMATAHSISLAASPRPRVAASLQSVSASLQRIIADFREGLSYVRRVHILSAVFVVACGWGLGNGVARALYSIFGARLGVAAAQGMVARPTDFGISVLFVAMGLGGVLGAPIARRFNAGSSETLGSRMGRSMIFDGIGLLLFSFMPNLWGAAVVLIAREINFAIWWTAQQTIVMSRTEDRFAGRVFASYETLTTLAMVSSMLVSGAAADRFGIRPVAGAGGAVIALSGLLWFLLQHRNMKIKRETQSDSLLEL
ncbi:MAG: hypothetical protein AUG51_12700 [Acidobacteria bacterium 13_1_20CM_3_53_8]|nr:MAG: hypothetical protein AUG51_12700 [Acidobacteria bacterium 13_1_20CM_3_53_8]